MIVLNNFVNKKIQHSIHPAMINQILIKSSTFKHENIKNLKGNNENKCVNQTNICKQVFKDKLSLQTCVSSVSIEEKPQNKNKYLTERKIYMKFLMIYCENIDQNQKLKDIQNYIHLMHQVFKTNRQQLFPSNHSYQINIPPNLISNSQSQLGQVYNHYCWIWLHSMGYKTQKNKQHIISRVKIILDASQLTQALKFYESMGKDQLSINERFQMIILTCYNGWEYFIDKIIAIVRFHPKYLEQQQQRNSFIYRQSQHF